MDKDNNSNSNNNNLLSNSLIIDTTSRSSLLPKRNRPLTAKTDKCIKFIKDNNNTGSNSNNSDIFDLPLASSSSSSKSQPSIINLSTAIDLDIPYGRSNQKESLDCINLKKQHMFKDDYFSSTVDKYELIDMQKLPVYNSMSHSELKKHIDVLFGTTALLDIKKLDSLKQRLIEFQIDKAKGPLPVNALSPCDSLITLMNVDNNDKAITQTFNEMKTEIKTCRIILNDGNSFYRAFMLGLFEHHILYANELELMRLIHGIVSTISVSVSLSAESMPLQKHNFPIKQHEVTILLYFIYTEVIEQRLKSAYDLLLKAINSSKSFDYALIKYMRIAIGKYIETNADMIFKCETWEEIEQIAAPAYLSNHCFDYKGYIRDRLLPMHFEADKFAIQLAPVVFRINLDLYAIEGTANEVTHLIYLKLKYHYTSEHTVYNTIALFYSFSRYHRLYSIEEMKFSNVHMTYRRSNTSSNADCSPLRYHIINPNYKCDKCNTQSSLIRFNHLMTASFCKQCLITTIDRIIVKRISHFTDEYYNNKEYYFRSVALSSNDEDKLYEEDFIALFNRNIPQQILYTMERLCFKCFKPYAKEKVHTTMPCECKLCHECLIDNLLEATDQLIVLNQYEKANSKLKKVYCPCDNVFDVDKAIELVYSNDNPNDRDKVEELTKEAEMRLHKAVEVICSFCGVYHPKANYSKVISLDTNIVRNDYLDVIRFSIIKAKDKNNDNYNDKGKPTAIANCTHIICKGCIKDFRQEIRNKKQKGEIGDKDTVYPLYCKVCLHVHRIDERKISIKANNTSIDCCLII